MDGRMERPSGARSPHRGESSRTTGVDTRARSDEPARPGALQAIVQSFFGAFLLLDVVYPK